MTSARSGPLLTLLGCFLWSWTELACIGPAPDPSPDAGGLEHLADHSLDKIQEPSGLSFANGRLYAVSDEKNQVDVYAADGDHIEAIDLSLVGGEVRGFEALAVSGDRAFLALEEAALIVRVDLGTGQELERFEVPAAADGNSGLEGLMVDPTTGELVAIKEKEPVLLIRLSTTGIELSRQRLDIADDLSGLSPICGDRVLAVSQQERKVFLLSNLGVELNSWPIEPDRAEGIAHDGSGRLYLVDEALAVLSVYGLAPTCD